VLNALKAVGKEIGSVKAVINGAGSAGIAIAKLLLSRGLKNLVMCDKNGVISEGLDWLNPAQAEMAKVTNRAKVTGTLADVIAGADLFIGVSAGNILSPEMVKSMAAGSILFPMANPTPEIMPDLALEAGAAVVGTGRSDYPNQINNVLAFPGIFRGALDVRAREINEEMKLAAAEALAALVSPEELRKDYILPRAFDPRVGPAVAAAVAKAAKESGVARI
ncbi:MAG: NAD-dependent malic enzyme, partial [Clostridia bacterium]|nr:NAD-dependent malic enzyme [Clostridia bacterium]